MRNKKEMKYSVGIGIKVHNRHSVSRICIENYRKYTPDAQIFVVDDGSDKPFDMADYRSNKPKGIAKANNRLLANLDHHDFIILADNDCWPTKIGWIEKYISAYEKTGCHHFSLSWDIRYDGTPNGNREKTPRGIITEFSWPCGVMMFMTKHCVDTIGGFDIKFGRAGHEHVQYSLRSFNNGLTPYKFCDVTDGIDMFYAGDHRRTIKTSLVNKKLLFSQAKEHFRATKNSSEYISYR